MNVICSCDIFDSRYILYGSFIATVLLLYYTHKFFCFNFDSLRLNFSGLPVGSPDVFPVLDYPEKRISWLKINWLVKSWHEPSLVSFSNCIYLVIFPLCIYTKLRNHLKSIRKYCYHLCNHVICICLTPLKTFWFTRCHCCCLLCCCLVCYKNDYMIINKLLSHADLTWARGNLVS